jgi:hypothetical protein
MTPAQLQAIKASVLASQNAEITAAASARNDTELARLLNLPSTFVVWRIDVPSTELVGAIKLASFTPSDAPDDTMLYNNRCALCELKQNNIRLLLAREVITAQKLSTRQDLTDALTNVPAGAGGSAIDAGWLGAGKVKATISRFATVAELAFATGTGTAAQPGDLGWEGSVNIDDIGKMWSQLNG